MRKRVILMITLLIVAMLLVSGCSSDNSSTDQNPSGTGGIQIDVDFNLNINVEEGKDADGFTWENHYNEITITGYIGASNELTVPNTINGKPVTQIKSGAMKGFTGLKSIVIPGSVKTIEGVFEDCTGLQSVIIAEQGLENMNGAFKNCAALKTVNVPSTVTQMEGAFSGCAMLESEITIPAGVTSLKETFSGCATLKKVTVHDGVENLRSAFSGCAALTDVKIPENATNLAFAFENCSSLKTAYIPANVVYIAEAFKNCTALENVSFAAESYYFYDQTPGTAFDGCISLKKLEIPAGLNLNGLGCIALEELTIHMEVYIDYYPDDLQRIELYKYVPLEHLPALKTLNLIPNVELERYVFVDMRFETFETETYGALVNGGTDWYDTMLSEAQQALKAADYDIQYGIVGNLEGGKEYLTIDAYYDCDSESEYLTETTKIENVVRNDNQTVYTCYAPAIIDGETAAVVEYTQIITQWLVIDTSFYWLEGTCGTDAYLDCTYSESITINGFSYPVRMVHGGY